MLKDLDLKSPIGLLRLIGFLEGISYLVLLGIAMPLKYFADMPQSVLIVGWAHGVLFMGFALAVLNVWIRHRWPFLRATAAMVASILPFGTFVLDKRLRERA